MFDLSRVYRPITAAPFRCNESYCEIAPCAALRPYIRCFWGTPMPVSPETGQEHRQENSLVVPDTCMDIIFNIDYTAGSISGAFCALDEHAHQAGMNSFAGVTSIFAIRFNMWAVSIFAQDDLRGSKNGCFAVEDYFAHLKRELEPMLFVPLLREKAAIAEKFLLRRLDAGRLNSDLMNALYFMMSTSGRERISAAAAYAAVSEKKLERIFSHNIGASPKCVSSLVRYQLLWQELVSGGASDIMDAVEKYGYFDQAHLINDFRRHHLLTPSQAVELAMANGSRQGG